MGVEVFDQFRLVKHSCHLTLRLSVHHRSGQAAGKGTAFSVLLVVVDVEIFDQFRLVIHSCHLTLRLSVHHRSGQAEGKGTAFSVLLVASLS